MLYRILLCGWLFLQVGCEHVPFTPEKIVVFSVSAGFRGPIVFRVEPEFEGVPQVQGHEFTYTVPASGIVEVHSMDLSNGALWKNYSVRYPDGSLVRAHGYGDPIKTGTAYLFHLGGHHYQGKSQELFIVSTSDERMEFQSLQGKRGAKVEDSFALWAELHRPDEKAPNSERSAAPERAAGRGLNKPVD